MTLQVGAPDEPLGAGPSGDRRKLAARAPAADRAAADAGDRGRLGHGQQRRVLTSLECDGHRLRWSSIGACLQRAGLGRTEAVGTGPWTVPVRRGPAIAQTYRRRRAQVQWPARARASGREQLPDRPEDHVGERLELRRARRRRSARRSPARRPADRPIARSAGVSPTTATRSGATRRAAQIARTMAGSGFTPIPSSPQASADTCSRIPRPRRVASVGARSSVVATAMRRSGVPEQAEQRREIRRRDGRGDRIRPEPGALDGAPSCGHARAPAADDRGDDLGELGHRRDRERALRRGRGRSTGSKPIAAKTSPATGLRVAPSRRRPSSSAQPPHIAWKSMSVPSLSKTTRSIPSSSGESAAPVTPRRRCRSRGPARRRSRGRPRAGTRR